MSDQQPDRPLVTLFAGAYNEEENLPEFARRLHAVIDPLEASYRFEVLLFDNASEDGTQRVGRELAEGDERWRYLRFSRNFGLEGSLAAVLHYARGDALIFLSSDLQEPPEKIPLMLERWQEGYDVVYGRLTKRNDGSWRRAVASVIAYRLIYLLSDVKIPPNATDFRLLSRRVIEALSRCPERNRYLRGLVHWVGFKQTSFDYERAPRTEGESTTGFLWCFNFALNALVAFSVRPLRWSGAFGLLTLVLSVIAVPVYVTLYFLSSSGQIDLEPPPPGWSTMFIAILFFGGAHSLFLGVIGEYIAKLYVESKARPSWLLDCTAGFPAEEDPLGSGGRP